MTGYDAAVIGAGPAGSAAAAILAERGRRVLLLERDHFPRRKVCGEFLSSGARASLVRLGVLGSVEEGAERIAEGSVHFLGGGCVSFCLPAPAIGISRFRLDELLARRAVELGAEARFGIRAVAVEGTLASGFRIRCAGVREEQVAARSVVGAWGRWDALDRRLQRGFLHRRAKFWAWSRDYGGDTRDLAGRVSLYLFPGGYCGLSRVEGGIVNLAGVVSERVRRRLAAGWQSVMEHARSANAQLNRRLAPLHEGPVGFLGTGPVYFTAKPPVERGVLMTGDAAGVIDPFSGEGQAAALASGILAAETLERGLAAEIPIEVVARRYAEAWRRRFSRRFDWGAAFRQLMLRPVVGSAVARIAGERAVVFAIRRMGSGLRFPDPAEEKRKMET
ncbi:MAG TPA: FAD-dependent monooxygenase [Thermoanaerobaculia bacterium]